MRDTERSQQRGEKGGHVFLCDGPKVSLQNTHTGRIRRKSEKPSHPPATLHPWPETHLSVTPVVGRRGEKIRTIDLLSGLCIHVPLQPVQEHEIIITYMLSKSFLSHREGAQAIYSAQIRTDKQSLVGIFFSPKNPI